MNHPNPSSEVAAGGLTCRKAVEDGVQAGRRPNPVREEDVEAATCTRTSDTMSVNHAQLEQCRALGAHSSTHLTHGAASSTLSLEPASPLILPVAPGLQGLVHVFLYM